MKRSQDPRRAGRQDFADLDALVLAEIESLGEQAALPDEGISEPMPRRREAKAPARRQGPRTMAQVHPLRGAQAEHRLPRGTGEEVRALFDESLVPEPARVGSEEQDDGPLASDLLSAEERAFVERASGFLRGRPNADLILDGIWAQVNAARPDGFYDPREVDAPDAGEPALHEPAESAGVIAVAPLAQMRGADPAPKGPRAAPPDRDGAPGRRSGEPGTRSSEAGQGADPEPSRE